MHSRFILILAFTGLLLVQLHRYKHDVDKYESKLLQFIILHDLTIFQKFRLVKNHTLSTTAMDLNWQNY